jgi:hypothetical protein
MYHAVSLLLPIWLILNHFAWVMSNWSQLMPQEAM